MHFQPRAVIVSAHRINIGNIGVGIYGSLILVGIQTELHLQGIPFVHAQTVGMGAQQGEIKIIGIQFQIIGNKFKAKTVGIVPVVLKQHHRKAVVRPHVLQLHFADAAALAVKPYAVIGVFHQQGG